ncbi:MAG: fatty acid desaturase [Limisphaerales bacterium]|jgi:fatty acid desaturase
MSKNEYSIAWPTIGLTVIALAGYLLSFCLVLIGFLPVWIGFFVNLLMAYILFTSMHEACHYNISGSEKALRWLDEFLGVLAGFTLFAPLKLFRVLHFKHHGHTNDEDKDPDHWMASGSSISIILKGLTILPNYLVKGIKMLLSDDKMPSNMQRELSLGFLHFLIYLGIAVCWISFSGWQIPVLLWILPAVLAQGFLAFSFGWLPHHPHTEQARYLNTRTYLFPGLTVLLLSQNLHILHHLKPRVPFYKYGLEFNRVKQQILSRGGLVYEPLKSDNQKP